MECPRNSNNTVELLPDGLQNHDEELPKEDVVLCKVSGDGDEITSLVFLPNGRLLASACKDNSTIRLWSVEHGQEVGPPMDLGVAVSAITTSKDGKWLVSGGVDGNVTLWNTNSHQKEGISSEKHKLKITTLDLSPDSLHIASGSDDGTIMVWHINSEPALRRELSPLKHEESPPVSSVKFSPAGGRIAAGYARSGYYTIRIWCSSTGDQLVSIPTDGHSTSSLAWSCNGQQLFAGGLHGSIKCFDVATRRRIGRWGDSQSDVVTSLYVSNTGLFLISTSASGRTIDIWDIRDISATKHLHRYRHSDTLSSAISPSEYYLVNGGKAGNVYKRNLLKVIAPSYFFHHVTTSRRHSEPLTYISNAVYEIWKDGSLDAAEQMLSNEIAAENYWDFVQYAFANRSLIQARLQKWDEAFRDAETAMLHGRQKLLIAHIAKGIALCGRGEHEEAKDVFDTMLHDCDHDTQNLVEYVKSIVLFEVKLHNRLRSNTELPDLHQDVNVCPLVEAQELILLSDFHVRKGAYEVALQLLSRAPELRPFLDAPEAEAISLIFGWDIYNLHFLIYQLKFQALAASGRTREAMELPYYVEENNVNEEIEARKGIIGRLSEKLGDSSMCHVKYDDAIAWYTLALALHPESRAIRRVPDLVERCLAMFEIVHNESVSKKDEAIGLYVDLLSSHPQKIVSLFLKRSKARMENGLWKEALNDANEAIRLDPLCPWGYERRRAAMPVKHVHVNEIDRSQDMLLTVERQLDQDICQLGNSSDHVPREAVIDAAIHRVSSFCPLVLIDVQTGLLCDDAERKRIFKEDLICAELLSSMTARLDTRHVVHVVARFFRYVMFSHTWEGQEPTFHDVLNSPEKSIYSLNPSSRLNEKLRKFCEMVRDDPEGYRWSWSDTCCINKTVESVYKKSIRSMYDWYKWSALTLILLADISEALPRELKDSRWMTRVWTLQEILSPRIVRFYDREWKPYRRDTSANHKDSPCIMRELAEAVYAAPDVLSDFSPESLGVREKLRMASTRNATFEEDIAYSLIGIFRSNLVPEPRDARTALGLLLQEVVDRYQETTVFDWTGEPSGFNSCLPARISVYSQLPYTVPSVTDEDMKTQVASLQASVALQQDATKFCDRLSCLEPLNFANHRLRLPCIVFPITATRRGEAPGHRTGSRGALYLVKTSILGEAELMTTEVLPTQNKLILIYPWIRDLLMQAHLPEGGLDAQALRVIVYLQQGFRALLFTRHPIHNEYRRIATDSDIMVPRFRLSSLKDVGVERLVIV